MHTRLVRFTVTLLGGLALAMPATAEWHNANVQVSNAPAQVVQPLKADLPLTPMPSATAITPTEAVLTPYYIPAPAATVSALEPLKPLPSEMELRAQARREAEARRPPPLKPQEKPQRVEDLGKGNYLILPEDAPLRSASTLSGYMFNDDTEFAVTPTVPEPLVTNTPAEPSLPSDAPVATLPPPEPAPVAEAAKPKPLPAPFTLDYTADITRLTSAQRTRLTAWAGKVPEDARLTVMTYNQAPPLAPEGGEQAEQELGSARWGQVQALLKQNIPGLNVAAVRHQGALTVKGEPVQRLVVKAGR